MESASGLRTDEELVISHKSGHTNDFRELIERYRPALFGYLYRFLRDRQLAEDAFQDAFLRVHRGIDKFQTDRKFKPWLYAIATNVCRDIMRQRKKYGLTILDASFANEGEQSIKTLTESKQEKPDEILSKQEEAQAIRKIVDGLSEPLRDVLLLFHYQDLKYREIADVLSIPIGTVKSRLHTALTKLMEDYKKL